MRKVHLWAILILFLAACTSPSVPLPLATLVATTPSRPPVGFSSPTVTAPVVATATRLPTRVFLVTPPGTDADVASNLQSTLVDLATAAGFTFEAKSSLTGSDLDGSVRLVVVLPPISGLSDWVAQSPQIQFVAVGVAGLSPAPNLTVIGKTGINSDQQTFLAGYIAAIMTPDWRVGILAVDSPAGQATASAFENGARYFCGLCKPMFPPYFLNQEIARSAATTDDQAWKPAADLLIARSVQTIYVDPGFHSMDLLQYLVDAQLNVLGGSAPPAALIPHWVATVRPDPSQALRDLWNDLLSGKGGQQLLMPLVVTDTQSGLLSVARQRLVQEVLDHLADGTIDPDAVP